MSKQVYISADYDPYNGDRAVVNELIKWGGDLLHKVDFIDMSNPSSGSIARSNDCRPCELKEEFNRQINASSAAIFVIGDRTALRIAGGQCERAFKEQLQCFCTPYKQNANGTKLCKVSRFSPFDANGDVRSINSYSYLRHEFEQAKKKKRTIIVLYNSTRKESTWLPYYMKDFESIAKPFWKYDAFGRKVGDYSYIKEVLGF